MLKDYVLELNKVKKMLEEMILSASGFRKVFAESKNEFSNEKNINDDDKILVSVIAYTISKYFNLNTTNKYVNIGIDTRATSEVISNLILKSLILNKTKIKFFGILPITELLAFTKKDDDSSKGFIYISASHNPEGHNGIKMGLNDGGVLPLNESNKVIKGIKKNIDNFELVNNITKNISYFDEKEDNSIKFKKILDETYLNKQRSYKAYKDLTYEIIYEEGNEKNTETLKKHILKNPIGIVVEMNGSSRINSIDKEVLEEQGIKTFIFNNEIGVFKHGMTPEGESLNICRDMLENKYKDDHSFLFGYVPDCDGDRGNLVYIDTSKQSAKIIEAQKLFALCVLSELACLFSKGIKENLAVVVNDATSENIEKIAEFFNAKVYRVEVGEANVTEMAEDLRKRGFTVKILGEGSNGGNITYPSKVRDPLATVFSIIKIVRIKELYKIWCELSGNEYKEDYTIEDILTTIDFYTNVVVSSKEALINIEINNQEKLKTNYEIILKKEFETSNKLFNSLNVSKYEIINYEGKNANKIRTGDSSGGLKVLLKNKNNEIIGSLWMRGSKTEPVFRVLSEVESNNSNKLYDLLEFQKNLIQNANNLE